MYERYFDEEIPWWEMEPEGGYMEKPRHSHYNPYRDGVSPWWEGLDQRHMDYQTLDMYVAETTR